MDTENNTPNNQNTTILRSPSIKEITKALIQAQMEMQPAPKDMKNSHFGNTYSSITSLLGASLPSLNKVGIGVTQGPQFVQGNLVLVTTLLHTSGEWLSSHVPLLLIKNDMQTLKSAITYARRSGLEGIIALGSEDDDGNIASDRNKVSAFSREEIESNMREKPKDPSFAHSQSGFAPADTEFYERVGTATPLPKRTVAYSNEVMPYGKHKGIPFNELPTEYLNYIVNSFDEGAIKESARKALQNSDNVEVPF